MKVFQTSVTLRRSRLQQQYPFCIRTYGFLFLMLLVYVIAQQRRRRKCQWQNVVGPLSENATYPRPPCQLYADERWAAAFCNNRISQNFIILNYSLWDWQCQLRLVALWCSIVWVVFLLVCSPNTNIFVRNAHRDKDMIKCLLLWQFATRQFIITHVPWKSADSFIGRRISCCNSYFQKQRMHRNFFRSLKLQKVLHIKFANTIKVGQQPALLHYYHASISRFPKQFIIFALDSIFCYNPLVYYRVAECSFLQTFKMDYIFLECVFFQQFSLALKSWEEADIHNEKSL